MALEGIVSEQGRLAETASRLDLSTIQHSSEICVDRIDYSDLRNKWFWTADGAVYTVEDKEAILYLTDRESNPILKNIEEATKQLINTQNYIPKQEDLEAAINSPNTLRIKLSDLKLKKGDDEYSYFEIDTEKYNKLNEAQRAFAERAFGGKEKFEEYMKTLRDERGTETTMIYVLNPDYVKDKTKENKAIARACGLGSFVFGSRFDASSRSAGNAGDWLRGVRCVNVAEGDAQESGEDSGIKSAYETVLRNVRLLLKKEIVGLYEALHPLIIDMAKKDE